MLRHAIAPARYFSQISNDILRNPNLNSDAVRLLTWQLSLPPGARECLSRTAERAHIGKVAFTTAKRQLQAAGYVHDWRRQRDRGLWVTEQLVSNVPLTPEQAAVVRDAEGCLAGGAGGAFAQVAPSGRSPVAGQPTGRPSDGHPEPKTEGNTSTPPPPADLCGPPVADGDGDGTDVPHVCPEGTQPTHQAAADEPGPAPAVTGAVTAAGSGAATQELPVAPEATEAPTKPTTAHTAPATPVAPAVDISAAQARGLIDQLPHLDPRLLVPRGMVAELTGLAAQWLSAGHQPADVQAAIGRGMPGAGESVHRPGGLVRYLLRDVPAVPPPSVPSPAPAVPADPPGVPAAPRVSARLSRMRECEGGHAQATLFIPEGDEDLCPRCRA